MSSRLSLTFVLALASASAAFSQLVVPGTSGAGAGSDGVFSPTANVEIDLGQARPGDGVNVTWASDNSAAQFRGKGIYDPRMWAVVFKFSSVNIPANVKVTFKNHPKNAPVVWLVQGAVNIAGTVDINAKNSIPGPGGFRGGVKSGAGSSGFGPGGSLASQASQDGRNGASFGSAGHVENWIYGNEALIPLIGGSGAATTGLQGSDRGAAGGGAILIGTPGIMKLDGTIAAEGEKGPYSESGYQDYGSGGGVKIVCNRLEGVGQINAVGPFFFTRGETKSLGRVRIEANDNLFGATGNARGVVSIAVPGTTAKIWPDALHPTVTIRSVVVGTTVIPVPDDPAASFAFPNQDVSITTDGQVTFVIETTNVPFEGTARWKVQLKLVPVNAPAYGQGVWLDAVYVSTTNGVSRWEVKTALPNGISSLQAKATRP